MSDVYNEHMEEIAIGMADYIYKNHKTYKEDEVKEALKRRTEKFNFSQICMIAFRITIILKIIYFLEEEEIQGNITDAALENLCKRNKYDIHTLKVAANIIFGKRKKSKIYAFLK